MAIMVTIWQDFLAVTEAFTTDNDHWLAIILSTVFCVKQMSENILIFRKPEKSKLNKPKYNLKKSLILDVGQFASFRVRC